MNAIAALHLPDARDSDTLAIHPQRELVDSNHLLDDHAALMRAYEETGYLLLRQVLDQEAVAQARTDMYAAGRKLGLIVPGANGPADAIWTGQPTPPGTEESDVFSGIANRLVQHPAVAPLMAQILGEPACLVPIVQYRVYPPNGPVTMIHQDGFYSPGIQNYKPVWIPLANCEREVGGLMVAVGQHQRGYFHNTAKPPPNPIPEGVIPADSWATTDYFPGDVLIVHPCSPHGGTPNRSQRCRVTLDTRVQSARNARVLVGDVAALTPASVTLREDNGVERTFRVDDDSFIRYPHPGIRRPLNELTEAVPVGARIVLVFDGDHTETLRKAAEG
jgi:ectoine hydroxylase-related dioxygenase (phytanoyl-CoA dioxygenase family)